jgi:hypothetical protein
VSKPLFLLFLTAGLAIVAGLHSGGAWREEMNRAVRTETIATADSLRDDAHEIRSLWDDARREVNRLETDAAEDSRIAAKHIPL